VIKKIKIELIIIVILILNIFITANSNIEIYNKFNNFDFNLGSNYLKDFFVKITELGNSLWFFLISASIYIICFLIEKITNNKSLKKLKLVSLFFFFLNTNYWSINTNT